MWKISREERTTWRWFIEILHNADEKHGDQKYGIATLSEVKIYTGQNDSWKTKVTTFLLFARHTQQTLCTWRIDAYPQR